MYDQSTAGKGSGVGATAACWVVGLLSQMPLPVLLIRQFDEEVPFGQVPAICADAIGLPDCPMKDNCLSDTQPRTLRFAVEPEIWAVCVRQRLPATYTGAVI